jgi:hypothetical protein
LGVDVLRSAVVGERDEGLFPEQEFQKFHDLEVLQTSASSSRVAFKY